MANVLDRAREAFDLAHRAQEALQAVAGTVRDGREVVSEHRLDQLQAILEQEKIETREAADNLAEAIAEYRKRREA